MKEDKQGICNRLKSTLRITSAGADITRLGYVKTDSGEEFVYIHRVGGMRQIVDVTADSGTEMIRDIMRHV